MNRKKLVRSTIAAARIAMRWIGQQPDYRAVAAQHEQLLDWWKYNTSDEAIGLALGGGPVVHPDRMRSEVVW